VLAAPFETSFPVSPAARRAPFRALPRSLERGGRERDFLGRLGEHGRLEIPEFHEGEVGLVHVENLLNGPAGMGVIMSLAEHMIKLCSQVLFSVFVGPQCSTVGCRCCEHISRLQCRRASPFRHEFTDHKGEPKSLAKST
jgi:hypothetical protein